VQLNVRFIYCDIVHTNINDIGVVILTLVLGKVIVNKNKVYHLYLENNITIKKSCSNN